MLICITFTKKNETLYANLTRIALERGRVADDLRHAAIAALGEGTAVELFGSVKTMLGSATSDVDATIITPGSTDDLAVDSWPADATPAVQALTLVSTYGVYCHSL